ncbi:MAG: phosphopantothenoylcysteine decarboxylase [Candidatus Melainabacteria bacterium HGW-Melainabacteria-1]|nr:MAG: phosphopantothenoylcysteine decarboxylase [Candidatus Melainabacteria bacterium HGW-Melainabacteria-1]
MSDSHDFWEPQPPSASGLGDHDVLRLGPLLAGRRIALLVSGGIAALKSPLLARELRKYGAEVTAFVSAEALRYVTADALAWACDRPVVQALSARAEHLGDGQRFDAYLVAPATYNILNKCRFGIADSLLSTVLASALGRLQRGETQLLVAPTMHGSMHNAILEDSLIQLQELGVTVLPPRDAYGKHNLPDLEEIVFRTARALSDSDLRGLPVLVTGGPTPVALDAIRRLSNRFSGALGLEIARALFVAGADVHWVHGPSALLRPAWLPCHLIGSYEEYRQAVHSLIAHRDCVAGIFTAAVADYQPEQVNAGKIPSGAAEQVFRLVPTAKVIQEVRQAFAELPMVTFKFEAGVSHQQLMQIARQRLAQGYQAVVANRDEEQQDEQVAWLVTPDDELRLDGKPAIAHALVSLLESWAAAGLMPQPQAEPEGFFGQAHPHLH